MEADAPQPPLLARLGLAGALLLGLGLALRLAVLWWQGEPELHADEKGYVHLAVTLNRFGFYGDSGKFAWPPGYPWVLAQGFRWFGDGGTLAVRLLQILLSPVIGAVVLLWSARLFGRRAALWAGLAWATYLPLVGFTHLLWPETLFLVLFLPALYLLWQAACTPLPPAAATKRCLVAGLLFGGSLLFKEVATFLLPLLLLALVVLAGKGARLEGLRRAVLAGLAALVVAAPWMLRNTLVYGQVTATGITLGDNVYRSLNAEYLNYDLKPLDRIHGDASPSVASRPWLVDTTGVEAWERPEVEFNVARSSADKVREGLRFALREPAYLLRSRLKKAADLVLPASFLVRHELLGLYPTGNSTGRRLFLSLALLQPMALLLLALPGLLRHLVDRRSRGFLLLVLAFFLASSQLIAMSRVRMPFVPLLLMLAGGALAPPPDSLRRSWAPVGVAAAALAFLWWADLPELSALWALVWGEA